MPLQAALARLMRKRSSAIVRPKRENGSKGRQTQHHIHGVPYRTLLLSPQLDFQPQSIKAIKTRLPKTARAKLAVVARMIRGCRRRGRYANQHAAMSDMLKNNIPTTKLPASILLSAGLDTVPRYATDNPIVIKIAKMKLQEKYDSRNARLNGF
jgi:hypothetical protein